MQYFFQVQYNDGEFFPTTKEEAKKMAQLYEDIDQSRLRNFDIYDKDTDKLVLRVYFDDPEKRLIHVRRHILPLGQEKQIIWLAGWQKKVSGKNIQSINLLFPDGHIESIGEWGKAPYDKPNQ